MLKHLAKMSIFFLGASMFNGWVKIHRSLLDWEWYHDIKVVRLFLHLLLKANHKDRKFEGQTIKRGQHVTSISSLSKETGLTGQQIRTALSKLISTNEITNKSTNKYRILTINNYDKYQNNDETVTSTSTNKTTINQQTNNKQITTPEECKNVKNKYTDAFQHLWEFYKNNSQPNSPIGEKKKAFQKYSALVKEFSDDIIFKHVEAYLNECKRTDTKTKHLVTFLNQHDFSEPIEKPREKTWEEMTPDERDDAYIAMAVKQGRG